MKIQAKDEHALKQWLKNADEQTCQLAYNATVEYVPSMKAGECWLYLDNDKPAKNTKPAAPSRRLPHTTLMCV